MTARFEELKTNLRGVLRRVEDACLAADRDPAEVSLVVVTKFHSASDVRMLAELGVSDVGENRHQEAEAKAAECADLGIRWHFIGGLQSNKASAVARYADVVESVDRLKLVDGLARGAVERGSDIDVLLQVSLDETPQRGERSGAVASELASLADAVMKAPALRLGGLMAVAPSGEPPRDAFARLSVIAANFVDEHPSATVLSAGMSGDLEDAIFYGATHVRVGSAILGNRPPNH